MDKFVEIREGGHIGVQIITVPKVFIKTFFYSLVTLYKNLQTSTVKSFLN